MKKLLAIVTLTSLLAGCATNPFARKPSLSALTDAPPPAGADAALPSVELSADLLYRLLAAELAFQRGQWRSAYDTEIELARQVRDPRLAHRAMEMAMSARQPDQALSAIRVWRQLDPGSEEAMQYFLGFVTLNDRLDEARDVFALRLEQAEPAARGLAMLQMQRFLSRAHDKAAAFALLEDVLKPYQNQIETHLVLALAALANRDVARATREADAARAMQPDSELAVLTQAQVAPDPAHAASLVEAFLGTHPQAREVRGAYARMLIDQQQYAPARRQFEALLAQQPDNLGTLYALGILCMDAGENGAAEQYFKTYLTVLDAHPDDERSPSVVLALLSQLAQQRGDSAASLDWLGQIEADDGPGAVYFGVQIKRARIIASQGDLAGARKVLTSLHTDDAREQVQLILAEAQILRDAHEPKQAFAVLDAGRQRFPDDAELLYDFAMAADSVQQGAAMETALRRVMELAPDNQHAYNALGYWLAEHNQRLPEAFTLISKALQLAPDDPFILDSMGWVQFRLGRLDEAEQTLRRAYALRADAEIAVHLGEVLWQRGQQAEAQAFFRAARSKDPHSDTLKSTLARLNLEL